MSKRILNKNNCFFRCSTSPSVEFTISQSDNNVKDGTGATLTTKAMISGTGVCSIQTAAAQGATVPCSVKSSLQWINGIELNKSVNGAKILNEDAMQLCPFCPPSEIKVKLLPMMPSVSKPSAAFDGTSASQLSTVTSESNENVSKSAHTGTDNVSGSVSTASRDMISEAPNSALSAADTAAVSVISAPQEVVDEAPVLEQEEVSPADTNDNDTPGTTENCLCDYAFCDKVSSCEYAKAPSAIETAGSSIKLRNKSPFKLKKYIDEATKKMDQHQLSWDEQAHHMISINDGYCLFKMLVKLGNYFGYDINCEENCCFLPCSEKNEGFGQMETHFKKARAYDVMRVSGLQWHVGNHGWKPEDIPTQIIEKYPELQTGSIDHAEPKDYSKPKNYKDLIIEKLQEICKECEVQFQGVCIAEHKEEYARWFKSIMNDFSHEIETKLGAFRRRGRDSFPYFVSAESFRFAYEIPRSGRVMLIYQTQTQWVFQRFKFSYTIQNPDMLLEPIENDRMAIAETHRPDTIKHIIRNCENVSCFLVIDDTRSFKLPFKYNVYLQYISRTEDSLSSRKSHFAAMLAQQQDRGEGGYISPQEMKKNRLMECGLK